MEHSSVGATGAPKYASSKRLKSKAEEPGVTSLERSVAPSRASVMPLGTHDVVEHEALMRHELHIEPAAIRDISAKSVRIKDSVAPELQARVVNFLNRMAREGSPGENSDMRALLHFAGPRSLCGADQRMAVRSILLLLMSTGCVDLVQAQRLKTTLGATPLIELMVLKDRLTEQNLRIISGVVDTADIDHVQTALDLYNDLTRIQFDLFRSPGRFREVADTETYTLHTDETGKLQVFDKCRIDLPPLALHRERVKLEIQESRASLRSHPVDINQKLHDLLGKDGDSDLTKTEAKTAITLFNQAYAPDKVKPGMLIMDTDHYRIQTTLDGRVEFRNKRDGINYDAITSLFDILVNDGLTDDVKTVDVFAPVLEAAMHRPGWTAAFDEIPIGAVIASSKDVRIVVRRLPGGADGKSLVMESNKIEYGLINPESNRLTSEQVADIKASHIALAGARQYSRLSASLGMIDYAMTCGIPLGEAARSFVPELTPGRPGDCMEIAMELSAQLAEMGVTSYFVGHRNSDLVLMPDPSDPKSMLPIPSAMEHCDFITHMDLVVPYVDDSTGEQKMLHLITGVGSDASRAIEEWDDFHTGLEEMEIRFHIHPETREGAILNPGLVIAKKVATRPKMMMHKTPDIEDDKLFGIDILGGRIYLNRAGSLETRIPRPAGMVDRIIIDFKSLLESPDAPILVNVHEEGRADFVEREMRHEDYVQLVLDDIAEEYGIPGQSGLLFVMADLGQEYLEDVLLPEVSAFDETTEARHAADAARSAVPTGHKDKIFLNKLNNKAKDALLNGRPEDAILLYRLVQARALAAVRA